MRFSKPSPRSLEKGRLAGSAQTRSASVATSSPVCAPAGAAAAGAPAGGERAAAAHGLSRPIRCGRPRPSAPSERAFR